MLCFVRLPRGRRFFAEIAVWATPDRLLLVRREHRELIVWIGRLHIIYTPAGWSPPVEHAARSWADARQGRTGVA